MPDVTPNFSIQQKTFLYNPFIFLSFSFLFSSFFLSFFYIKFSHSYFPAYKRWGHNEAEKMPRRPELKKKKKKKTGKKILLESVDRFDPRSIRKGSVFFFCPSLSINYAARPTHVGAARSQWFDKRLSLFPSLEVISHSNSISNSSLHPLIFPLLGKPPSRPSFSNPFVSLIFSASSPHLLPHFSLTTPQSSGSTLSLAGRQIRKVTSHQILS
jgi:hypothetical protein